MAFPDTAHLQRHALEEPMGAEGHQIVHQVVVVGDAVEDTTNQPGLFCRGDLLEAKIDAEKTVSDTEANLGNTAVGKKFCLKFEKAPKEIKITATCERKWFPQGNAGTYVFTKKGYSNEYETTATGTVKKKTGKTESDVIKIMRKNLKPGSFRLWRKRVHNTSIKHRKKFKLERKKMREKIKISDMY